MLEFLGWALIVAAAVLLYRARRSAPEVDLTGRRARWAAALGCLVLGGYLAVSSRLALASRPVDVSNPRNWVVGGPDSSVQWELAGPERWSRLKGRYIPEGESYVLFPVDWRGHSFRAEWDITFTTLEVRRRPDGSVDERASLAIGVTDGSATSLDDPDHVGGSGLQACFSDDVRLRMSDENRLLKTHSATECWIALDSTRKFTPSRPQELRTGVPYHCVLAYDSGSDTATLTVSERGRAGHPRSGSMVERRLEDLPGLAGNLSWFGVTIRGYKRRNKQREAKVKGYTRPAVEFVIENLRYRQA